MNETENQFNLAYGELKFMKLNALEYNRLPDDVANYCALILPLAKNYLNLDDLKITSRIVDSMATAGIDTRVQLIKVEFSTAVMTYSYIVGELRYVYGAIEYECDSNIYHNILRGLYRTKYEIDQGADPAPKLYPMED